MNMFASNVEDAGIVLVIVFDIVVLDLLTFRFDFDIGFLDRSDEGINEVVVFIDKTPFISVLVLLLSLLTTRFDDVDVVFADS